MKDYPGATFADLIKKSEDDVMNEFVDSIYYDQEVEIPDEPVEEPDEDDEEVDEETELNNDSDYIPLEKSTLL
jgi:hypothetical protein